MSEALFWTAALVLVYTYAGYPVLITLLALVRPRPVRRAPIRPRVTLLIVVYNEARHLREKLENALALRYPANLLEIVVASDGSEDGTVAIAREFGEAGIRVVTFPQRRGKPCVLNDVTPSCAGDIVVLSDARQLYGPGAIEALVENFGDPEVGGVSGELCLVDRQGAGDLPLGEGVGVYWRYEKLIRRQESEFDSSVGATGAIYAIRRRLFEPVPAETLVDDVLIPLRISRRGYRIVFEPGATATDQVSLTPRQEFVRKVRTVAGTVQLFVRERWLWSPRRNRLWVQAMSHKLLRILGPYLLAVLLVCNVRLLEMAEVYRLSLVAQAIFYGLATVGWLRRGRRSWRLVALPYAFCLLNAAALMGAIRFVGSTQAVTWQKAADVGMVRTSR